MRIAIVIITASLALVAGCASSGKASKSDSTPTEEQTASASGADDGEGEESGPTLEPPEGFESGQVLDVVSTVGGRAVLLTKEPAEESDVVVPIFIGRSQAHVIQLRLDRRRSSRPLTHDLLDNIVGRLGGEIVKVHIGAIKSGVFVGTVFVEKGETTFEVDSRSSDAIALALGNRVPIFVSESVFEKAGVSREKLERRGLGGDRGAPPRLEEKEPEKSPPKKEGGSSEEGPFL